MTYQRVRRGNPTAGTARAALVRQISRSLDGSPADLRDIARLVERLSPERSDPERFFLRREEVAQRLRTLANNLEAAR